MRAMGVDVSVVRGLDLVVLDELGRLVGSRARQTMSGFEAALGELQPDIVAIDSPPNWATAGRSRPLERELARLGISMYATPQDPGDHEFYRWMRVGFAVFAAADRCGYPLYRGDSAMEHHAVEVFPHASAVALRGSLPGGGATKLTWRRAALDEAGVEHQALRTIDQIDAALAALTGLRCLQRRSCTVGVSGEAVLALPIQELPRERYSRDDSAVVDEHRGRFAATVAPTALPALTRGGGLCECGCGAVVRRRYLPGHDAKHRSQLRRQGLL